MGKSSIDRGFFIEIAMFGYRMVLLQVQRPREDLSTSCEDLRATLAD
jgi:hypothetical protein